MIYAKKPETKKRGILPKTVLGLGAVSFFTDASTEMIVPLLPLFVESLGAGVLFLGLLEGTAEATASFLKLFSGYWADKVRKKKPLVLLGYGLSSLSRAFIALVLAPWQLLGLRFLDRIGKGIRTSPRDALLAAVAEKTERGRAFGFHRAADHAGAVFGPLLALLFLSLGFSLRAIFLIAILPALLSVLSLLFWVHDPPSLPQKPSLLPNKPSAKLSGPFWRFLLIFGLFSLGNSPDALLLFRAQELGVSASGILLLWASFHAVKSLLSTPFGGLSDRIGRKKVILIGWGVYSLSYTLFALVQSAMSFCAIFALYGVYYALVEGSAKALVTDLSPEESRGRAFGAYHATLGLVALPAGLLAGWLWQAFSAQTALFFGAGCAGVAAILFWQYCKLPEIYESPS